MESINVNEKVLICPLGWGLGHATRIIPIIDALLKKGCEVLVGADPHAIRLIGLHFPSIDCFEFRSIDVKLSRNGQQAWALTKIALNLLSRTAAEHKELKRIVVEKQITTVISDNRYGLYCKGVKSIIITHQLSPIFPKPFSWLKPLGELYIRRKLKRFSECWIPDCDTEPRLTGELSSKAVSIPNAKFIGFLSRFSLVEPEPSTGGLDLVGLVSGPEPQRAIFEQQIIALAQRLKLRSLIVRGLPQTDDAASTKGKITLVPHLPDKQLAQALASARYVICRSGYSTIMDLITLKRSAILVPTPGQTEQEYLANRMSQLKLFSSCKQDSIKRISIDDLEQSCNTKVSQNQFCSSHFVVE